MNILDKIVADKLFEIKLKKEKTPVSQLTKSILFERNSFSLSKNLKKSKSGIIAEFKRKSPSKSEINMSVSVSQVSLGYQHAGVSGISILTDEIHFGGNLQDLISARNLVEIPILRKEFIVDEYQIIEAKSAGADCILLIAAILTTTQIKKFSSLAKILDLEVLLEVHNELELKHNLIPDINLIGVNNRNLKNFDVDVQTSKDLSGLIPNEFVKISESGISSPQSVKDLMQYGYKGFLIGENFMKNVDPGKSAKEFIYAIEN